MDYRRISGSNHNERPKLSWRRDPVRVTGGADVNPRGDTRWYDVSNAGTRSVYNDHARE